LSEQIAISPRVCAFLQSKLGRPGEELGRTGGLGGAGCCKFGGCEGTVFASGGTGAKAFASAVAVGRCTGCPTRPSVANNAITDSALRRSTTLPLPSAAG